MSFSNIALAQHPGVNKKRDNPKAISTYNTDDDAVDDNGTQKKRSYFSIGANYLSNNVYLGRKDSMIVPYISPYVSYTFKNGIYLKAIESYQASKTDPHFDLFTFEFGYSHIFWNALSASAAYDRYFFSDSSANIKSAIKSSFMLSFLYMNNYVEPQLSLITDRTKNNQNDFVATVGIDHAFFLLDDNMNIIPTITANAGTQNYYNESVIKGETKKGRKVVNRKPVGSTNQFELLDYEISIQAIYKVNNWVFLLVPTYVLPQNPSTNTIVTSSVVKGVTQTTTTVNSEKLENSFFLELDISHRFYRKQTSAAHK